MDQAPLATPGAMLFECNEALVLEAFRRGEFDYVDALGEVSEADFFRAITERKILSKLAESYPSPRERHDVPLWVYLASNLSMRFHGEHHFHAFPYLVRSGGMIQAFGPAMGHKAIHPETGDVSLRCEGFNEKNDYDRQTPCDQDYLRKMARDTEAHLLETWFNRNVVGVFKQHHAFDAEGIFIGDATHLFVPDNSHYEGSALLLFDEHNHPVNSAQVTPEQRARCVWRRCCKKDLSMDVLIPVRKDMDIYHDVVGMAEGRLLSFAVVPAPEPAVRGVPLHRPERIRKREEARQRTLAKKKAAAAQEAKTTGLTPVQHLRSEVATVADLQTFTTCPVSLHAVVNREIYSDGRHEYWVLLDTARITHAVETRDLYRLRTSIEERHRQLKCFSDLERFSSRAFSLVVNQVVFVLLLYSLLQWYWLRIGRPELRPRSRPHALAQLRPTLTVILIYYQNYVARLSPLHYQELLLTLSETARRKILTKTQKLRRGLAHQLDHARAP